MQPLLRITASVQSTYSTLVLLLLVTITGIALVNIFLGPLLVQAKFSDVCVTKESMFLYYILEKVEFRNEHYSIIVNILTYPETAVFLVIVSSFLLSLFLLRICRI